MLYHNSNTLIYNNAIQQKLVKSVQILNNTFKPTLAQKCSIIKAHNSLTVHILLYGSEILALKKKNKKRLTSIEMKIFRRNAEWAHL